MYATAANGNGRREGPRQGHGPAPGAGRIGRRHGARVVRLLHLRDGRRAGLRRPVLQRQGGFRRRHAGGLRHLRRRLRRAPARRDPVRQHGRPHRPPRDADRHDAADGHLDRHHRPAADLRDARHLGADPADADARLPGPRRRRRVRRRLDAAGGARAEAASAASTARSRSSACRSAWCSAPPRSCSSASCRTTSSTAGAGGCRSWPRS